MRRAPYALLLLLAPLIPLWRCLTGEAIGAFDQIRQLAPWNGPKPGQPWDVLQADGVLQFWVWRDLVFKSWGRGQLPAWNPYELAGTPLLANSQSGVLYPPHILVGLLHLPTGFGMFLLAWTHLALAGFGTSALVRRLGGSALGGAVAGLLFSLSPFMLGWTALPSVIETVAWIPWVLANLASVLSPQDRLRRASGIWLAVSVAGLILAGHLQFVAYGVMAAAILGIALVLRSRDFIGLVRAVIAIVAGACVAAPQLLPVLSYSQFSHRRNVPTEDGYHDYLGSALRPTDLVSRVANPYGQGDPNEYVDASQAPYSTFWPALSRPGANFAESALTLGPLTLALIGLLVIRRPKARDWVPMAAIAALALLLGLGTPLNRLLYFFVPGWSSTGSPGRIVALFVLAGCVLAGLALRDEEEVDAKKAGIGIGIAALVALLTLVPLTDPAPNGLNSDAWGVISGAAAAGAPMFLLATALAAFGVWCAATRKFGGAAALLAAMTLIAVLQHPVRLVRTGNPDFLASRPIVPAQENGRIAVVNGPWALVAPAPALYPPNTLAAAGLHDLAGYDSLMHRDSVGLLKEIDGQDAAPEANGNMMFVKATADPAKLADAGVTEVWSRKELPTFGTPAATDNGVYVYRLSGPGRFEGQPIEENLQELKIRATGPKSLVVRERNMPGWSAKVDGASVPISGSVWREIQVPAGEHTVEFRYSPPGLSDGLMLGAAGIAMLIAIVLTARRRTFPPKSSQLETADA